MDRKRSVPNACECFFKATFNLYKWCDVTVDLKKGIGYYKLLITEPSGSHHPANKRCNLVEHTESYGNLSCWHHALCKGKITIRIYCIFLLFLDNEINFLAKNKAGNFSCLNMEFAISFIHMTKYIYVCAFDLSIQVSHLIIKFLNFCCALWLTFSFNLWSRNYCCIICKTVDIRM